MLITVKKHLVKLGFLCVVFSLSAPAMSSTFFTAKTHHSTTQASSAHTIKPAIISAYGKWKGVRYKFGGTNKRGIDCSALMQKVFRDAVSVGLPRTTEQQIKLGTRVSAKKELRTGDLVFFKTSRYQRHVGVYIGNSQFIHASRKRGVTISTLNNSYWARHYELARRVVTPGSDSV